MRAASIGKSTNWTAAPLLARLSSAERLPALWCSSPPRRLGYRQFERVIALLTMVIPAFAHAGVKRQQVRNGRQGGGSGSGLTSGSCRAGVH